jgi:hypothetical protein
MDYPEEVAQAVLLRHRLFYRARIAVGLGGDVVELSACFFRQSLAGRAERVAELLGGARADDGAGDLRLFKHHRTATCAGAFV